MDTQHVRLHLMKVSHIFIFFLMKQTMRHKRVDVCEEENVFMIFFFSLPGLICRTLRESPHESKDRPMLAGSIMQGNLNPS